MKIIRCSFGYEDNDIYQGEFCVKKSEFQRFYENGESVNEMVMKLLPRVDTAKDITGPVIKYVTIEIEDQRLPQNTVMEIVMDFEDDSIAVGLCEYDDSDVRLPIRNLYLGTIHGSPLIDDGKRFFFEDLLGIVEDYVKEAEAFYKNERKGN